MLNGDNKKDMTDLIWKNRIIGYAEVDPNTLLANPDNWRTHPMFQREVVGDGLKNIGWLQDIIVNVRGEEWPPDDRVQIVVDGHLRIVLALDGNQPKVPVKYVSLSPEEEALTLLMLDPSSAMASADKAKLKEMLDRVEPMSDTEKQFLDDLAKSYKLEMDALEQEFKETDEKPINGQFVVLIECQDEMEQTMLLERFLEEGLTCKALIS